MDDATQKRNIVRLRTYADDFKRIQTGEAPVEHTVPEAPSTPPTPQTEKVSVTPAPKIHLKEEPATKKSEDGVAFFDADNKAVEDSTYEENRAVEQEKKEREEIIEVPIAEDFTQFTQTPKQSLLSDTDEPTSRTVTHFGEGTIIKDTKRQRFHLLPAIVGAIQNWFGAKKEAYEKSHEEKYHIAKAQSRIETIKAAAQKNTQAPDEDYSQVAQKLKQTPRVVQDTAIAFKPKSEVPQPRWGETKEREVVIEKPIKEEPKATPATAMKETTPVALNVQDMPSAQIPKTTPTIPPQPAPVPQAPKKPARKPSPRTAPRLLPYIFVAVVVLAIGLGVGASIFFFQKQTATEPTVVFRIPSLIAAHSQIPVPYDENKEALFTTLRTAVTNTQSVVHLYPSIETENGYEPVPSDIISPIITQNAPGSFTRAVTDIAFGGANAQPFIILKVTNFDTGFAGMLQWEDTMSSDLSPLFGAPVSISYDAQQTSTTIPNVREAFFKDIVASNRSARVLVDETNKERIIYAFTDKNTIVITTNRETLSLIAPLVQ